jgi:hypothetical protein
MTCFVHHILIMMKQKLDIKTKVAYKNTKWWFMYKIPFIIDKNNLLIQISYDHHKL